MERGIPTNPITTKDKDDFLSTERLWFSNMTDDEYRLNMTDDAVSCEECGTWYWNECAKRCECK